MMSDKCSICGCTFGTFVFKSGHVCEGCIQHLKDDYQLDSSVRYYK